jgi:dinuclear metal center YbgI/SA1388 family protein
MPRQNLSAGALAAYCDRLLRVSQINDYDRAVNGLQVENRGRIVKIAAAVDGSLATVNKAIAEGANFMIVHHGVFWSPAHPWTGGKYELMRVLIENDVAIYSSHLPLDVHPKFGNNVLFCQELKLRKLKPFFFEKNQYLGLRAAVRINRRELVGRVKMAVGGTTPKLIPGGPEICNRIGVVTGGAGGSLKIAADEGVDTFITGEGPHWTFAMAEELGINVIYGGHYATETFGVKALAAHLSRRYGLPWIFVDHPTGL